MTLRDAPGAPAASATRDSPERSGEAVVLPDAAADAANARRLQILATEHWSLLATRSLTYSESMSRVAIFLSALSAAVVALALLAQADRFHYSVVFAAILILSVVLFLGVATIVRLSALNRDDFRSVVGMNRLRRGYLDLHPELAPYFLTDSHDDLRGIMATMDMDMVPGRWSGGEIFHGFEALPSMLGVMVGVVAGVLGALIASLWAAPTAIAAGVGVAVFIATVVVLGIWARRAFAAFAMTLSPRFPSP